ncbi:MAG: restriction endonuclease, SacI family [Candidatus Bipolaricaulota bacterium]|nr:restriction endonuclease, SacI family [Candidatus Bipolaricaulota bacterium]
MGAPRKILNAALRRAKAHINQPLISDTSIQERVTAVCRNISNRACVRLLMAALLAKIDNPTVDIRKPYTEIGTSDAYSGRSYDEKYIQEFIIEHDLPCNPTTAFLTPALRNRNTPLTPDLDLEGRPKELYKQVLQLLADVHEDKVPPEDLLAETIRCLLIFRDERKQRLESMLAELRGSRMTGNIPLSAEAIVTLIQQHLTCPDSSRLPVLIIAAAYKSAESSLKERVVPLRRHTAADSQTRALGDLEITLIDEDRVITSYEMKARRVTRSDINQALQKVMKKNVNNYIFITTDAIEPEVQEYAKSLYKETGGIEFVILDCIGFLRHFLHLFHRLRMQFLDSYQDLVLEDYDVRQELKEAFLALRRAAESSNSA